MQGCRIRACFALSVVVVGALPALCPGDEYRISAGGNLDWGPASGGFNVVSATPVDQQTVLADSFGSAPARAFADFGIVGAQHEGSFTAPALQTRRFDPQVAASAQGFVIFSGPGPSVNASMNVAINGTLTHPASAAMGPAFSGVRITATLHSRSEFFDAQIFNGVPSVNQNDMGLTVTPAAPSISVSGTGQTGIVNVPTGVPVWVQFILNLSTIHLSNGFAGSSMWDNDFASTVSFGATAFNLPAGYTANGFGVVDNVFVIPEPSSAALLLLAAPAIALMFRLSRQRRAG
jgi:hypothetical protein